MTNQIVKDSKYPVTVGAQRMQDLLLATTFGLWALLLGLSPVLAIGRLIGS
jgi:hypothetical protein